MTPERWNQVKQVLDASLQLESEQRSDYVEMACAEDAELLREVKSLLSSHEQAGTQFLGTPVVNLQNSPETRVGRRIGSYDVVEELGYGGMGEVYRCARADGQYTKQVAIKMVRGGFNTAYILERFRYERQILAGLDHPNIARLLDGGTTEGGIPYLVMELVEGTAIDRYCDARRLTVTQRLQLFLDVCSAVQYAHQRLVIHRDIKPSNILVTEDGVAKLLDFGIAKILDPSASGETTVFRPMTPEYASPEQVRGEAVTTAADVYSLSVVLYQLLTGHSPYREEARAAHQLTRAICEEEPERPSTMVSRPAEAGKDGQGAQSAPEILGGIREGSLGKWRRRLQGDLDNIVLKGLRKEPQRRYVSVEQFAEDIHRHLAGLPVTARKDSWSYRTEKFIRRHRVAMAVSVVILMASIAGVAAIVREARIAKANGQRAEKRFNDVRKLANSLMFEVHDSIKDLPGSTPARKLLVSRALEYLDSLSQEAKGDASLQRELGAAYRRIGDVQGQSRQANLGDQSGAVASYRKAIAIQEALLAANANNLDVRRELVITYGRLSDLLRDMGDSAGSIENSRKEMEAAQAVYNSNPADPANRLLYATYRMDYGYKQVMVANDSGAGLDNLRQGSAMLEQIVADDPQNRYARRVLGLSYSRIADALAANPQDKPQAIASYKKALTVKQGLLADDPNNTDYRRLVAYDQFNIAHLMGDMNDPRGMLELEREALSSFQQLASADPASAQYQQDIAELRSDIGSTLVRLGELTEAVQELNFSMAAAEKMPGAQNPEVAAGLVISKDQYELGKVHALLAGSAGLSASQKAGQCQEAETWFRKCLPAFEHIQKQSSPAPRNTARLADIRQIRGRCATLLANNR